jgi:endonuclease YncB( thermonuclease family)
MRSALLTALTLVATPAQAQIISGPARAVDGDTLNMTGFAIRLHGIDAPEASQTCKREDQVWHCGSDATALLSRLVAGRQITCEQQDTDVYGRIVGSCRADRRDLAASLVSAGLAIALPDYSDAYVELAAKARSERLGIWAAEFQIPADYRAANPSPERQARTTDAQPKARRLSETRTSVYYRNCNEARAAGAAPLYRGGAGYRLEMDGDRDGIACEPYRGRR